MSDDLEYGTPAVTHVALIVEHDPASERAAARYVEKLPRESYVHLCAHRCFVTMMREAAGERVQWDRVSEPMAVTPHANVVVIFGVNPLDPEYVKKLETFGVPVEHKPTKPGRRRRGRHAA